MWKGEGSCLRGETPEYHYWCMEFNHTRFLHQLNMPLHLCKLRASTGVLTCSPFHDWHSDEDIATILTNSLSSSSLAEKLHVVVRDNGSNFVAGLLDGGFLNIPCLANMLVLVIKNGCLVQLAVTDLTARTRNLVRHYKHSNIAL